MADQIEKLVQVKKSYFIDDGQKRGPLTMFRLRHHPSAPLLLGQCVDRRLALWNLDGEPTKVKKGEYVVGTLVCPHEVGWIRGFDVHPGGQAIVTGGSDRRLKRWTWNGDSPTETPTADVAAHAGWVEAVRFSPDGSRIATAGADRQLKVWDGASLSPLRAVAAHSGYPRDLAWTPDGKLLVTGDEDGRVLVWNSDTLEQVAAIEFGQANEQQGQDPSLSGVYRVAVSRDGRWVAAAGAKQAAIYELATGHGVALIKEAGVDVAFDPRHDLLAIGENQLRVWQYDAGKFEPKSLAGEPDKNGKPKPVSLPSLPGKEIANIKRGDYGQGLSYSPDGGRLALGKADGTVDLWELTASG